MSKDDEDVFEGVKRWIDTLPSDSCIKWTSYDVIGGAVPQGGGSPWADIEVPELQHELKIGWVWTIVSPSDPGFSDCDTECGDPGGREWGLDC